MQSPSRALRNKPRRAGSPVSPRILAGKTGTLSPSPAVLNERRTRGGAAKAPDQSENVPPTTAEEPCQNLTRASIGAESPLTAEVVKRTRGWPKGRPRGKKRPSDASTAEDDVTGNAMDVDKLTDEPVPTKRTRGQAVEVQPVVRDDQWEESGQGGQNVADKPGVSKRTRGRPPKNPVAERPADSEEEDEGEDQQGDNGEAEKQRRKKLAAAEEEESLMAMHALSQLLKGSTRNSQQVLDAALAPRPFALPFRRSDITRLKGMPHKATAERTQQTRKSEDRPKPFQRIRKMAIHESVADRADAILRDDQVAHCQCVSASEAKRLKGEEAGVGVHCNEGCVNRMLCVECTEETCAFARAGKCQNQRLAKRQTKGTKVYRTESTGWGLKAMEDVEVGELIIDFVGEVISTEECDRRMEHEDEEATPDLYFVDIGGAVVDAGAMGNDARFVNHSCDPNSQLQKWSVDGQLRLGIYAIKPIAAGEQITYNYAFCHYSANPMRCHCGAETCAGLLTTKPPPGANVSPEEEQLRAQGAEAEAFRAALALKLRMGAAAQSSLTSFFNGRPDEEGIERGSYKNARLFLVSDGRQPSADDATNGDLHAILGRRLEAITALHPPTNSETFQGVLAELAKLQTKPPARRVSKGKQGGHIGVRKGLTSVRKRRITEASQLTFLKQQCGGQVPTLPEWPAQRWEALEDMILAVQQPADSTGAMDLNEDFCANCGGAGELLCCDGCTSSYHMSCASLYHVPQGTWLCPRCRRS